MATEIQDEVIIVINVMSYDLSNIFIHLYILFFFSCFASYSALLHSTDWHQYFIPGINQRHSSDVTTCGGRGNQTEVNLNWEPRHWWEGPGSLSQAGTLPTLARQAEKMKRWQRTFNRTVDMQSSLILFTEGFFFRIPAQFLMILTWGATHKTTQMKMYSEAIVVVHTVVILFNER